MRGDRQATQSRGQLARFVIILLGHGQCCFTVRGQRFWYCNISPCTTQYNEAVGQILYKVPKYTAGMSDVQILLEQICVFDCIANHILNAQIEMV
jgi:hypothetical protein